MPVLSIQHRRWAHIRELWPAGPGTSIEVDPAAHSQLWRRPNFSHCIWGVCRWSERVPPGEDQSADEVLQLFHCKVATVHRAIHMLLESTASLTNVWWPAPPSHCREWHCCNGCTPNKWSSTNNTGYLFDFWVETYFRAQCWEYHNTFLFISLNC